MKKEITITREQFLEFVRNKDEDEENESPKYYLKYFDDFQNTGKKARINWYAFLYGYFWFLYRRMYLYGVLIFLFECVVPYVLYYVAEKATKIFLLSYLIFGLVVLRYANYIYLRFANKKINSGSYNSGVNMWMVWCLFWFNIITMCIPEPILLIIKAKLLAACLNRELSSVFCKVLSS